MAVSWPAAIDVLKMKVIACTLNLAVQDFSTSSVFRIYLDCFSLGFISFYFVLVCVQASRTIALVFSDGKTGHFMDFCLVFLRQWED